MGPPPPGATQGLGVTAMRLLHLLYTPVIGGCQLSDPPTYESNVLEGEFSEVRVVGMRQVFASDIMSVVERVSTSLGCSVEKGG